MGRDGGVSAVRRRRARREGIRRTLEPALVVLEVVAVAVAAVAGHPADRLLDLLPRCTVLDDGPEWSGE